MGATYVECEVRGAPRKRQNVRFLVDSGASYSLLPKPVWRKLGLKPKRKMSFMLADGTSVERSISEAFFRLSQSEAHSPVILGEEGDKALLGVVTLENLGLVLNPFNRTLNPMRMLLC